MAKQDSVTSGDGTTIVFDRSGDGPPVVVISAGPTDRSENPPVADLLSDHFTVFNYDRRASGDSGDTAPFAVDREYDDLAAVIDAAGGSACVYGTSGGAVALEAAARGLGATRLALWKPPFVLEDEPSRPRPPADYGDRLVAAVAAGHPGDVVALFFTDAVGMPAEFVAEMREAPFWPAMEGRAQALVYDAAIMGDFSGPGAPAGQGRRADARDRRRDEPVDEPFRGRGRERRPGLQAPHVGRPTPQRRPRRHRAGARRVLRRLTHPGDHARHPRRCG
jgi:hypothetical protein